PTEIEPLRVAGAGFAATVNDTDASPCPFRSPVIVTHVTVVATDHVQSRAAVTARVPLPPDASKVPGACPPATSHLAADGAVMDVLDVVQAAAAAASSSAATIPARGVGIRRRRCMPLAMRKCFPSMTPASFERAERTVAQLRDQLSRAIVGQRDVVDE